jgi:type I restriction enzyme, S subunit
MNNMTSRMIRIESFAAVFNGKTPSKGEKRESGHPVLKIKNLDEFGNFRGFDSFVDDKFRNRFLSKALRANDILILNAAHSASHVGSKIVIIDEKLEGILPTGEWLIVRSDPRKISPELLYFYFKSSLGRNALSNLVKGIHLYPKDVAALSIALPDELKRNKILSALKITHNVAQQRRLSFKLLDDYLRSCFIEIFGDLRSNPKMFEVKDLCTAFVDTKNGTKCGPFGSALKKHEIVGHGVPVWAMDNIEGSSFIDSPRLFITKEKYNDLESYSVKNGDIIISRAGTVGKMCVVKTKFERSIISTNLIRLSLNSKKLLPEFFVFVMSNFPGMGRLKTGPDGTYTFMNTGVLEKLPMPFPPLSDQNHFLEILNKINAIKDVFVKSDGEVGLLSQSILDSCFAE